MGEHRVRLEEKEFSELVAGQEVRRKTEAGCVVVLILADIGFGLMQKALDDAVNG